MDDQFNGRTDDDLFSDDFEPITDNEPQPQQHQQPPPPIETQPTKPLPAIASTPQSTTVIAPSRPSNGGSTSKPSSGLSGSIYSSEKAPTPQKTPTNNKGPSQPSSTTSRRQPKAPRQAEKPSVVATEPNPPSPPVPSEATHVNDEPSTIKSNSDDPDAAPTSPSEGATDAATTATPTAPAAAAGIKPSGERKKKPAGTFASPTTRLQSGGTPRAKLTAEELSQKMETMQLRSAELTRKFKATELDEQRYASAVAESAREDERKRLEAEERRRLGEVNRRQMDNERARNRERKLKAMSQKEGGWDEGKESAEQEDARKVFRGVHGGVRGTKSVADGLGASRFASNDDDNTQETKTGSYRYNDNYDGERSMRGRGRGGGRGNGRGGGRGGRGDYQLNSDRNRDPRGGGNLPAEPSRNHQQKQKAEKTALLPEDFPALPTKEVPSTKDEDQAAQPEKEATAAKEPVQWPPMSPAVGRWDEEMQALDEKQ